MRILDDYKAYAKNSVGKGISTLIFNPCFHSIVLYRFSSFLYHVHISPLAKAIWYLNRVIYNVDLDYRSQIDGGFRLIHGLGVVIGCDVVAGKNLTVYQGVTLGGNGCKKHIGAGGRTQPYVEDNVTIYVDAKVFGPIHIESGTKIKAGRIVSSETSLQKAIVKEIKE